MGVMAPHADMVSFLKIRPLDRGDISLITEWARQAGFAPGKGDVGIYRQTDRQGIWVGCLRGEPIGCIAGVRYNLAYGFVGLYIVRSDQRGRGYGQELWRHALAYLDDVTCVGLEAAEDRIDDYANWGFQAASPTTRWQRTQSSDAEHEPWRPVPQGLQLVDGDALPEVAVQIYDAQRELSPRPHFLSDWLHHPAGTVLALMDADQRCHGFGRIRPCLLRAGEGWRIGPLLADSPQLAAVLMTQLLIRHPGVVLLDTPGGNPSAPQLMTQLGFEPVGRTLRMYRGKIPEHSLEDVFALACLELG